MVYTAITPDGTPVRVGAVNREGGPWYHPEDGRKMHVCDPDGRARHFRRNPRTDGNSARVAGGPPEHDRHRRGKLIALEAATNEFADRELARAAAEVGAPFTCHIADAVVEFTDPHPLYGCGLAIEFQYRNEGKDVQAATDDYLQNGYTAVWIDESQIEWDAEIPDVDLFSGRVAQPFPDGLPDDAHSSPCPPVSDWLQPVTYGDRRTALVDRFGDSKPTPVWVGEHHAPAHIPPAYIADRARLWHSRHGLAVPDDLISAPLAEFDHTIGNAVPATLPDPVQSAPDLYDEHRSDWIDLFPDTGTAERQPEHKYVTEMWLHDQLVPWLRDYVSSDESLRTELLRAIEYENPDLSVPGARYERPSDPDRPPTALDTVQCRSCGAMWSPSNPRSECRQCGAEPDIFWNLVTARITDHPRYETASDVVATADLPIENLL